jgi:hypothetical protein
LRIIFCAAALVLGAAAEVQFLEGRIVTPAAVGGCDQIQVFVDSAPAGAPAVAGTCRSEGSALVFAPRFPLQPGLVYRVMSGKRLAGLVTAPKVAIKPSTRLIHLYPSTSRLPENQLKLYLHFSAPMSRGEAYRRIRLLKEDGSAVELPFLEIEQELWDAEGKRLTLLFDPGRIKRGLVPNQEEGLALVAGHRYSFVVDSAWPDAAGAPLVAAFRKDISAVASDRTPPDPARWRIEPPRGGSREPLRVDFGEPMDHALATRLVRVEGVPGEVALLKEESVWEFTPAATWPSGEHELVYDTALEDLAGNRILRPFDVDLWERVDRQIKRETRRLPFRTR